MTLKRMNAKINLLENSKKIFQHLILIFLSLICSFPFIWMISSSLKSNALIFSFPPKLIPNPVSWVNYPLAWKETRMGRAMLNSLFISIVATFGDCLISSMVAYSFAKIKFRYKNVLFAFILATMMIPYQVILIPLFIIFKQFGWINTFLPLIVPSLFGTAVNIFLMRQYMTAIPNAYTDSAFIDGCNHFQIWLNIMIPMSSPVIVSLGVLTFMRHWNNYLAPMLYLNDREKMTVPLILRMFQSNYVTEWHLLMAAACIALLPILIIYLFSQRYIIGGIMLGGVKG